MTLKIIFIFHFKAHKQLVLFIPMDLPLYFAPTLQNKAGSGTARTIVFCYALHSWLDLIRFILTLRRAQPIQVVTGKRTFSGHNILHLCRVHVHMLLFPVSCFLLH